MPDTRLFAGDPRLQRLNRLATIGTLSAGAAHEIKNALVPVKTFIDLLIEQQPDSELAGIVRRELNRINLLVQEMLKLSGPARPLTAPVSLKKIIEDSLRLIGQQAADKMVFVQTRYDSVPDLVAGDANQLEQVFLNLLLNAFEAVSQGGRIEITTRYLTDERQVETLIVDNGPGMPQEALDQLFQPFFTTKEGGTGLGLCITKAIIDAHGGSITAQNALNSGASFTIRLPAHVPAARQ